MYVWRKENWDHLPEHAEMEVAAVRTRPNSEHFIGTIITKQMPQKNLSVQSMQMVDGQQRLTTVVLALKTLADTATGEFTNLRNRLMGFLTYQDSRGLVHLRIKHSRVDAEAIEQVMRATTHTAVPVEKHNINAAYHYFLGHFEQRDDERRDQFAEIMLQRMPASAKFLINNDERAGDLRYDHLPWRTAHHCRTAEEPPLPRDGNAWPVRCVLV